jgi:hypothetical protein
MKLREGRGNCVPTALHYVSGQSEETVMDVSIACGYDPKGGGMAHVHFDQRSREYDRTKGYVAAARALGMTLVPVGADAAVRYVQHKFPQESNVYIDTWTQHQVPSIQVKRPTEFGFRTEFLRMTLAQFAESCDKNEVYMVEVVGHMLVVNRGVIHDPNCVNKSGRRRVVRIYRVEGAKCPAKNQGKYVRRTLKRWKKTGVAFERFAEVVNILRFNDNVTPEMLLKLSSKGYNKSSLAYDIKRGFLEMYGD